MTEVTRCPACGYHPADYTDLDRAGTLRAADPWWDQLLSRGGRELVDPEAVHDADDPVHNVVHGVRAAGRILHDNGGPPTAGEGRVSGLFVSAGGVPKHPVDTAEVGPRGLAQDRQAKRKHHGRPWQAVCLWATETIDRLVAEGHPIGPGKAGENIDVTGLDWAGLRSGVRLAVGGALLETSVWSAPCTNNAQWFVDRDFGRLDYRHRPGASRIYAWVVEPGTVRIGDPVTIEP